MTSPIEPNLVEALILIDQIRQMAIKADAEQWNPPPREFQKGGSGPSKSGEHSDPTGDLASNPARLALRQALSKTEGDSKALLMAVQLIHKRFDKALKPYGGIK